MIASPRADEPALVRLSGVSRTFLLGDEPVAAVRDVSLTIGAGESLGITGRSGSGKSTLLNLMTGIDRPTVGTVHVGDVGLDRLSEDQLTRWRGTNVGIVFQFFQLLPTLSALDNILLAMEFVGRIPARARLDRAMTLLDRVGLANHARKAPGALSGGEQQRAAVARALANDPVLLVADEPTGNLDSKTGAAIIDLLLESVDGGTTLVVITHDAGIAGAMNRTITIADGVLVP
jgi:putative ABC transport system ATP-binding protein